jgi:iron(III) transport system substrate-binding protein
MIITYGILANTQMVKPQDEPKSWADLTNPKWKGKILSDDTRAIGGGYLMFFATRNAPSLGVKFHEELAKQNLVFTRDMRDAGRRVARGEYALYMPFIYTDILNLKGLPLKAIIPSEGSPYVLYGNVQMRNAPHPNAARLYMDFVLSEEAQTLWAKTGQPYTRKGLEDKLPPDLKAYATVKLLGTTDPDQQDEGLAMAKKIYK